MTEFGEMFSDDSSIQETLGDYLRRHREASGKTLDSISRVTRISKRYLVALEENDLNGLPEDAFARGFLKIYAKELGLDVDDAMARYHQFRRSLMPTQIRDFRKVKKDRSVQLGFQDFSRERWWMAAATLVVLALIIGLLVYFISSHVSTSGPSQITEENSILPTESSASPSSEGISDQNPVEEPAPVPSPAPVVEKSAPLPSVTVKPSLLVITAVRDTKLSIRLDGGPLEQVALTAGEQRTLTIYKEVEVRSDDRSAVQFLYNGKPIDVSGPTVKLFNRHRFSR